MLKKQVLYQESMNDARHIAVNHGFKHFDIREEFGDQVIDRFVDDFEGRTPNPWCYAILTLSGHL